MKMNKNNSFTSKADILKLLSSKVNLSKIELSFAFEVNDWIKNQDIVLRNIKKIFKKNIIIVRSSALDEDTVEKSGAGNYESVLFVNPTSKKQLIGAVSTVINSYKFKGSVNKKNQVLIQKQTLNSDLNGVIFTKTPKFGAPYFIINYNENNNTESVTKGENSNVIKIFKNTDIKKISKKWKKLIEAVKELERILNNHSLDIEFAISKKDIIIFQVRPITTINSTINLDNKQIFERLIFKNKKKFKKFNESKKFYQNQSYFSDMSDWNPAEIIGNSPNLLDYSLYEKLIMKDAWHRGRSQIGYQKIINYPLMTKFGNKPYVNIKASFYSLIPNNIKKKYRTKLMKFYLDKFQLFPYLHDKVEFEILFTCYDFDINKRLNELLKYNFNKKEILEIKNNLIEFTNDIINEFPEFKRKCNISLTKMKERRTCIIKELKKGGMSHSEQITCIKKLLDDCKKYGVIPFSSMARIAFIANILLKSLEKKGVITNEFVQIFMKSIKTPLSEFQNDMVLLQTKQITKKKFLETYGHLRPGTYDITALPYNKQFSLLNNIKIKEKKKKQTEIIEEEIKISPLESKNILFLNFIKDALVEREKLKFEFTKNLSEVLELIAKSSKTLGFTREEIANLDIKTILNSSQKTKIQVKKIWQKKINNEIKQKKLNEKLILPSIIFSEDDFNIIKYYISKPNFITTKKIESQIIILNKKEQIISDIDNKIILIENADPGYDWIFTKKPSGLITKYGGVASHMSIRCAETNLPAAIGCGDLLFEQLLTSKKILLDCQNEQIISLEDSKTNELMEVKKTLKTLGYIK